MFGRKTLEFMLMCIGDEMRDSLFLTKKQEGEQKKDGKA